MTGKNEKYFQHLAFLDSLSTPSELHKLIARIIDLELKIQIPQRNVIINLWTP